MGLQLQRTLADNPGIRGIMLGGHGLFTWGDTSFECYINSLEVIETASAYLEANYGKNRRYSVDRKSHRFLPSSAPLHRLLILAPVLRGLASSEKRKWSVPSRTPRWYCGSSIPTT
ncbi:hypothetical protein V8V91_09785 [Algoriphagus halophilus]